MTLVRTVVLLGGALVVMLAVVVLRAETTRLHYQLSQYEREAVTLRDELRRMNLELWLLRTLPPETTPLTTPAARPAPRARPGL
jgi:hypothetical protein